MGEAVYAIDDFPDDDLLWRIEWIGGVGYNTSVPSESLMDVCIAQPPPAGETNPLSARFCTVAIMWETQSHLIWHLTNPAHFTPEKDCYTVLFLQFFRKADIKER